ncbi:MAG: hypothetical protein QOJ50_2912 [Cryptosporangiaceae bacterium]|nr:hypothetical protein [Cryptosporangiaceae bacterium]
MLLLFFGVIGGLILAMVVVLRRRGSGGSQSLPLQHDMNAAASYGARRHNESGPT